MGYRTCHFSSLGVQGFLAEVAMGTTEIFKCPAFLKCLNTVFHITSEQIEAFTREFIERMPGYIKNAFARVQVAA